ncbi:MAG TPA: hypothetical protein VFP65_11830, partial [Anaeromyxobacteraceae bacterium]|nr:hypothetical protein [Anaeromyxobacteraceae bacterium]
MEPSTNAATPRSRGSLCAAVDGLDAAVAEHQATPPRPSRLVLLPVPAERCGAPSAAAAARAAGIGAEALPRAT